MNVVMDMPMDLLMDVMEQPASEEEAVAIREAEAKRADDYLKAARERSKVRAKARTIFARRSTNATMLVDDVGTVDDVCTP